MVSYYKKKKKEEEQCLLNFHPIPAIFHLETEFNQLFQSRRFKRHGMPRGGLEAQLKRIFLSQEQFLFVQY